MQEVRWIQDDLSRIVLCRTDLLSRVNGPHEEGEGLAAEEGAGCLADEGGASAAAGRLDG